MKVKMLYEKAKGDIITSGLDRTARKINEASDIDLEITYVTDRRDFYRRLVENPSGYDIAVLHVSGGESVPESRRLTTYSLADEIKTTDFVGKLVAESGVTESGLSATTISRIKRD